MSQLVECEPYDYIGNVRVGDRVEASIHRDFSDSAYGEVVQVAGQCCNVRCTLPTGEIIILNFCWYEEDPRMDVPGKFEESQKRNTCDRTGDVHMGVFRFTKGQKALSAMGPRLASFERLLEQIVDRLHAVETPPASTPLESETEAVAPRLGSIERLLEDVVGRLNALENKPVEQAPAKRASRTKRTSPRLTASGKRVGRPPKEARSAAEALRV